MGNIKLDKVEGLVKQAGNLLKKTRLEGQLTQQELGEKLNLNKSTINRYESGEHNLTLETFEKVMSAMGKNVTITVD